MNIEVIGQLERNYLIQTDHNGNYQLYFTHRQPDSQSSISICIIASGTAVVQLEATVDIQPTAVRSRAWLNITIVTLGQAQVTASPNLQIATNQAHAGHRLTTRHLSDEQLFYLASRGISSDQAEQLIVNNLIKHYNNSYILNGG